MADVIQLLPDSIANQIAAGEVIQRPASVVKELMENAIDAGATEIRLVIKDAGKSLIQVIDNGCGMTETDARMSFERHATSKIRASQDLFSIRTMGFRGEALASIAAISQVEVKSRLYANELGTRIVNEASEVKIQESCQTAPGTNFSVKNLFFNVPARRKFLKSDTVEFKHILDEFQRLAIANSELFFSLHHNGQEVFHLPPGNLRQRIVKIFGTGSNKKLVPVEETTDVVKLTGFVGKPEFAKKTRGEQYFFVNQRFIKSGYLHHALMTAYEKLLPEKTFPFYVIFIDLDPSRIDINIHPTKQEIKFDDERLIYNYLRVAVRHALGQYSVMPSMDFDAETSFSTFNTASSPRDNPEVPKSYSGSGSFKPPQDPRTESNLKNWQKVYDGLESSNPTETEQKEFEAFTIPSSFTKQSDFQQKSALSAEEQEIRKNSKAPYQLHNRYIVNQIKSGFILIDQQSAHERILYEKYLELLNQQNAASQKELFPLTIKLNAGDNVVMEELLPHINSLGFEIESFGMNTYIIHGIPADVPVGNNVEKTIEALLDQYKDNVQLKLDVRENLARSLAKSAAIKRGKKLGEEEMKALIDQLFACEMPFKSPSGRSCFITYDIEELNKKFE